LHALYLLDSFQARDLVPRIPPRSRSDAVAARGRLVDNVSDNLLFDYQNFMRGKTSNVGFVRVYYNFRPVQFSGRNQPVVSNYALQQARAFVTATLVLIFAA
jgi:hypothetical protein